MARANFEEAGIQTVTSEENSRYEAADDILEIASKEC